MDHVMKYTPSPPPPVDETGIPDLSFMLSKNDETVCSCGKTLSQIREELKDGHLVGNNDVIYALMHQITELQNNVYNLQVVVAHSLGRLPRV